MESNENPLLKPWSGPAGLPDFASIGAGHFRPAFDFALRRQRAAIDAIVNDPAAPSFDNTVAMLDKSGLELDRVGAVFFNLLGTDASAPLQEIERELAPRLARHRSDIFLNAALFARISELWKSQEKLGLNPEQARVLERYHTIFTRAGAQLPPEAKQRLGEIMVRLATLGTQFSQNLLADESDYRLELKNESDLAGLPAWLRAAASQAAADRGEEGSHVITLSRSSIEPFLAFSSRRDLRQEAFAAWIGRGERQGPTDNRAIIGEMLALRAERAELLGYASFADFRLADSMAKTPASAARLLNSVWRKARPQAEREAAELAGLIAEEGGNFELAPWDWRFYAQHLAKHRFDFDESELKPYFQLENMIEAALYVANRLFGLTFAERRDVTLYNCEARLWEVSDTSGRSVGLFIGDYFARASKKSGAWMSAFRNQQRLTGDVRPIILNVMNFAKPPSGEPALLSLDDARTLFHEFGHALHGLLSNVTYPLIAGTNVARDFVELPSQLFEHWLEQEEILSGFALHAQTGDPMPVSLIRKVLAARGFNQGFATVEYTASALVDLELHLRPRGAALDILALEKEILARLKMPAAIVMRHRTPHFGHIFAGEGYAAGYYSYLWSEVLDADGFEAFSESGDIFDPAISARLHRHIYSAGSLQPPDQAYRAFRGRDPRPEALMRKRGLERENQG